MSFWRFSATAPERSNWCGLGATGARGEIFSLATDWSGLLVRLGHASTDPGPP